MLLAAPAFAVEGFAYVRDIQVPAAGWVRVPLDLPAVQHMAAGGMDLHVFGPEGAERPVWVEPLLPASERRPVEVVEVQRGEDGWTLVLDVGAEPVPHERLFFDFVRATAAPAVRLEGSSDGESWQTLAVGDLFRIGGDKGLQRSSLSYPSTQDRYLRLTWPEEAGFPRVSAVEVETIRGPSLTFSARGAECRPAVSGGVSCELPLPALGQLLRRLTVTVQGTGAVGYRLYTPHEARWQLLAEGVWHRAGEETSHTVGGEGAPVEGAFLFLELYGADVPPRLAGYGVDLAVQTVRFRAEEPGSYVLAYGGPVRRSREAGSTTMEEPVSWLQAGPEREQALPPLPGAEAAPGAPLERRARFRRSWTVLAPAAKPGGLVRLELPDPVYGAARSDLSDLRLALGDRQLPFFRWSPLAPGLAVRGQDLQPRPLRRSAESEVEINLPAEGLPLTSLHLTVQGGPLRRPVGVRYRQPGWRSRRLGDGREPQPVDRSVWSCEPEPPLPCLQQIPLEASPSPSRLVAVRFHDGDNPPLSGLGATLWRRRDVLLFVWPEVQKGDAVRLLAGSDRLAAPVYDFAALGEALLARPSQPAELELQGAAAEENGIAWGPWVMPAVLTLAGIFLLLLLRRILAET